jgi:uncharacterized protein YdhG (YjbR/CyaY superfamily)
MYHENINTLAYFQTDKPKKAVYKTNDVRHIESEIKQYGYAYCYNQTLVEELKKKGYIVDGDMVIKNGSL